MKKTKQHTSTKVAIFAGAAALMALTPQTRADSSTDALLNKLEQKGILTVDEAKELKSENATNSVADFNKGFSSKIQMPDWVTSYKLSGDLRGRYDQVDSDLKAFKNSAGATIAENNVRLRYRLRVGLLVNMQDNLQVGFRLGTDDTGKGGDATTGNPLSNNSTFLGNGSKKPIWVDAAYGKWTPINNDTWIIAGIIGKMDQPFQASPMVFDPDFTPEGGALQATYKFDSQNTLALNAGAFVIDQINSRGPYFYGAQAIWNSTWTPHLATSAGIAGYDIANLGNITGFGFGATPYDSNLGNTMVGSAFKYHYNPIVASGSVTYTLDSFPLYAGKFPVKLAGEYMDNPAAPSNNKGYWAGVTLGKSGKRGAWDVSYRYQRLEADAWWDQVVDDDNIATFPTAATTGTAAGGTNVKGHLVKFNYSIYDSLTLSVTCYVNDLVKNTTAFPTAKTGATHFLADLTLKF
ncbi:MAG TPA: putative porin [Methylomirabilota bacterium]|nr:putative porin [Methylomirabilota bacterium]